jgi:hypothetical protein
LNPGEPARPTPKRDIHGKKLLLCFFWSMNDPLYWEILEPGVSINSDVYCRQLNQVQSVLERQEFNGPVLFLQTMHALTSREKLYTSSKIRSAKNFWTILPIVQMLLLQIIMFSGRLRTSCVEGSSETTRKLKRPFMSFLHQSHQNSTNEASKSFLNCGSRSIIMVAII